MDRCRALSALNGESLIDLSARSRQAGGIVRSFRVVAGVAIVVVAVASVAVANGLPPGGTFVDDDGHIFEGAIEAIAAEGITSGCNPPTNDKFCPNDKVTRGEMAVFLVRAMGYSDNGGGNLFVDDDGFFYENSADRLKTSQGHPGV